MPYRPPTKNGTRTDVDLEQILQAYEQGYEARRLGKRLNNPWPRTLLQYDEFGYTKSYVGWQDELNLWYSNGYYDWTPGDWIPWLADDQQSEWAVNPKTNKARTQLPKNGQWPTEAWNDPNLRATTVTTATAPADLGVNLDPVVA